MTPSEQIIQIQQYTNLPDKKMAELCEIQPSTYSKCKSEKEARNKFNQGNLDALKNNLKKMLEIVAQY